MRIDKFLWHVRYFKTRSIATTACTKGHIKINGAVVKPSKDVCNTDIIDLRKDQINFKIKVIAIPESRVGAKLVNLYIIDLTPKSEFETNELLKYAKDYYRKKGVGRPSKKDRRDIDGFIDENE